MSHNQVGMPSVGTKLMDSAADAARAASPGGTALLLITEGSSANPGPVGRGQ